MANRGEDFAVAIEYKGEGINDLVPKKDMPLLKDTDSYLKLAQKRINRWGGGPRSKGDCFAYN